MSLYSKAKDVYITMLSKEKNSELKEYKSSQGQSNIKEHNEIIIKNIDLKKTLSKEPAKSRETKKLLTEQERQKILSMFYHFDQTADIRENSYEFTEIKRNYPFFLAVKNQVFEKGEYGYSFLDCTFNETETQSCKGYLIVSASRLLFVSKDFSIIEKLHFNNITNVQYFNDVLRGNRLIVQDRLHYLDFSNSSDFKQMKKAASFIQKFSDLNK